MIKETKEMRRRILVLSAFFFGLTLWYFTPMSLAADTTAPTTPTGLTAVAISSSQINLSWTASTDNTAVTGYNIYRCAGSGCAPTTQIATSATNSYSDTGLTASTAYTYAVSAYEGNESGKSGTASATTQASTGSTLPAWVPATSPLANKEHPRLFFTSGDLPALRDKLRTQYATELQEFINFLDAGFHDDIVAKKLNDRSNDTMNYTFLYLIEPSLMVPTFTFGHTRDEYGQKAIMHGLAIAQDVLDGKISMEMIERYESINIPMALVYDWSYSLLTLPEKRKFADAFIKSYQTRILKPGLQLSPSGVFQSFRGPTGGLAIWGDNLDDLSNYYSDQSQVLLDSVKTDWIDGIFASLNHFQDKSGWRESWSYNQWSSRGVSYFAGMLSTAISQDYFYSTGYIRYHPLFFLYSIRPYSDNNKNNYLIRYGTMGSEGNTQQLQTYSMRLHEAIGSLSSSPDMAGLAQWMIDQGYGSSITNSSYNIRYYYLFYHFIWGNKNVVPKSPSDLNLPIAQKFGSGQIIMKTGFTDPSDTLIQFWAPKFHILPGGHPAPDFASFDIEKYGKLALTAGNFKNLTLEGKSVPRFSGTDKSSMFHNSIGVYKPGEISKVWGNRNVMGYRDNRWNSSADNPTDPAYQDGGANQVGEIKAEELNAGDYNYINYDYSRAWDSTKVSYANREFVYLNPTTTSNKEFIVVFDRVTSVDPSYKKRWLLWSSFEPESNGTYTQDTNIAWKWESNNSNTVKITNNYGTHHGRLFSKTLLPNSFKINKTGGPGHEFTDADYINVDGQAYDRFTDAEAAWIGAWRTEVESTTNQKDDLFLHVLEIGDSNTLTAMTPTERIDATSGNMAGALIRDLNVSRVLMFSKTDLLQSNVTYTVSYSGTGKHLITNLEPATYNIYKDGVKLLSKAVPTGGPKTLYFEAAGGGTFSITQGGPPPADTAPPAISSVSSSNITPSSATITWTTDEPATSQVEYGTTTSYGSSTVLDSSLVSSHSQVISGLSPSTTYHFQVKSKDAAGNLATSSDYTFTTSDNLGDTTPPVISTVSASSVTSSGAAITWTTDEAATSQVEYGTTVAYDSLSPIDGSLANTHSVSLSVLTSQTAYHYRVRSKDASGNEANSTDYTFTTLGTPIPPTGAQFINFQPASSAVPDGYQKDDGSIYSSDRGYGWDNNALGTRERNVNSDKRLDTFVFIGSNSIATWSYNIANGNYLVSLASGDPSFIQGPQRVELEGIIVINDVITSANKFASVADYPITINDGQLTVKIGGVSGQTLLNYIIIKPQDSPPPADITPPAGTLSINAGATYLNSTSAALTLSATDSGSGMGAGAQMRFSNDEIIWSTAEAYSTSKAWTLSAGDGLKTVYAKYKDTAGNWMTTAVSDTIILDAVLPILSISAPTTGSTVSGASVIISAAATDTNGIAGVQFKLDGANLGAEDTTSPYAITWDTTTTANSAHTLTAIARDNAGNSATSSAVNITVNNILPDTQAPTTPTGLTAAAISSSQINLSWTASTDDVGVAGYKIYRCSGSACAPTTQIATSPTNSYSDTGLTASTAYTYAVSAYDAAGNESGKSANASATTQASTGSTLPAWVPVNSPLANKEHPRLFFTAKDLPALRDKLKTQYKTELQDFINALDAGFNDDITAKIQSARSYDAMNYAFLYLIDPNQMSSTFIFSHTKDEYGRKAIAHGLVIANDVLSGKIVEESYQGDTSAKPISMAMAVVYDWGYPLLVLQEKQQFADAFIKLYQIRNRQLGVQLSEGTMSKNYSGPVAGLAIWDDNLDNNTVNYYADNSQQLLDLVKTDWIDGIYASLNYFYDKSGWRESWSYNSMAWPNVVFFSGMLSSSLGQDYFFNTGYIRYHPLFFLYSLRPYSYNRENYVTRYGTMSEKGVTQQLLYYSKILHGATGSLISDSNMAGLARWIIDQGYGSPISNSGHNVRYYYLFYHFIWGNKNVISKSPQDLNLPIAQKFGSGQIIMKTGFTNPADTLIEFWAPKFQILPGGHPSPDFASFTIEKYGKLALNAGNNKTITIEGKNAPTFFSVVKSSMFHNVIGVYKPGEISIKYDKRNVMGYRDGGFDQSGNKPSDPAYQDGGSNQVGDLKASELNQGDYNYINYNYSKAWDATKVSYANREFLYLNPTAKSSKEYTVIFDRITSADPTYKKKFLLWSAFEPQTNGTFTQDPGIAWKYDSANSDTVKISNTYGTHHGRLFSKTLLPNSFKINKTGGPGHEFTDADYLNADVDFYSQNYGQLTDAVASWIGAWRTEIESTTNQKDDLFLHVMEIGDSNTLATMTPTQRIESSTGNMVGALIHDPNAPRILMFSRTDPLQTTVTYTAIYAGTGKHLITNLEPATYNIYKDGVKLLSKAVPTGGPKTLSFEADGGGTFSITPGGPPPADTTPPVISNVSSSNITSSSATITWTTDESATTQVEYGLTTSYGSSTALDSSIVSSHSQVISGLSLSTTYHFRVKSKDGAGNLAASGDYTFITSDNLGDTTPPVISSILASSVTTSGAAITWTTDEAATSQVEYGATVAYGSLSPLDGSLANTHSVSLSVLTSQTTYHYRVRSKDASGNEAVSTNYTFTTIGTPIPPTGVQFINFQPASSAILDGYQKDDGSVYSSTRGYGWDNNALGTRERNVNSDKRLDTFVFIGSNSIATWSYNIANGNYLVSLASGDPSSIQGPQRVELEGIAVINNTTFTYANKFDSVIDYPITVNDGQLTVKIGGESSGTTLLNYIIIKPQDSPPPADITPPAGTLSINAGAVYLNSTSAALTLSATDSGSGMGAGAQMRFSNDEITWSTAEAYSTSKAWTLSAGDGLKAVYAKYKDTAGNWMTTAVSDTIILDTQAPRAPKNLQVK